MAHKHKVISLLQPWASLVVMGHKRIETRSFTRSYRGPLLIHASQNTSAWKGAISDDEILRQHYNALKVGDISKLPFGAIIGSVNLIAIEPSERSNGAESVRFDDHTWYFTDQERAFGDYSPGRYLWLLSDPVMFETPIPAKGSLGIWEWEGGLPQ